MVATIAILQRLILVREISVLVSAQVLQFAHAQKNCFLTIIVTIYAIGVENSRFYLDFPADKVFFRLSLPF